MCTPNISASFHNCSLGIFLSELMVILIAWVNNINIIYDCFFYTPIQMVWKFWRFFFENAPKMWQLSPSTLPSPNQHYLLPSTISYSNFQTVSGSHPSLLRRVYTQKWGCGVRPNQSSAQNLPLVFLFNSLDLAKPSDLLSTLTFPISFPKPFSLCHCFNHMSLLHIPLVLQALQRLFSLTSIISLQISS